MPGFVAETLSNALKEALQELTIAEIGAVRVKGFVPTQTAIATLLKTYGEPDLERKFEKQCEQVAALFKVRIATETTWTTVIQQHWNRQLAEGVTKQAFRALPLCEQVHAKNMFRRRKRAPPADHLKGIVVGWTRTPSNIKSWSKLAATQETVQDIVRKRTFLEVLLHAAAELPSDDVSRFEKAVNEETQ